MRKILIILLSAFLSCPVLAWEKTLSVDYVLGDGDSRITAKVFAQEALRVKASKHGKTYIQTSTTLDGDGELSETIEVVGASMVEINNYTQEFRLNDDGRIILTATADVGVDESVLQERIQAIQKDGEKEAKIRQLALENANLRSLLFEAGESKGEDGYGGLVVSMAMEEELLADLNENRSSINAVFQQGTLLQLASVNALKLEAAKRSMEQRVLSKLLNTNIEATINSVIPQGDGFDVLVDVEWESAMDSLKNELQKWFEVSHWHIYGPLKILQPSPSEDAEYPFRMNLFDWLARKQIMLEINIEGVSAEIPMLYVTPPSGSNTCRRSPRQIGRDALRYTDEDGVVICLSTPPLTQGERYYGTGLMSPLTLHLTAAQARKATAVETDIRLETIE